MSLPKWLKERLGTPTRNRGCRHVKCAFGCRGDVLVGFDEDDMALPAIVDPVPLSALGEALARVEGRRTYRLGRHKEGLALWYRNAMHIRNHPAGTETIVVADHVCGVRPLPSVEISLNLPQGAKKGLPYDEPPY